jgi:hypothetical protein
MCLTTPELIATAKDIVLALAAVVTATVAVKGLNTWNRQLRGTADFDVARCLAKAAYKVRERLQSCRSPLLSAQEFPPGYYDGEGKRSPEQDASGYAFVYSNRWSPVWDAMQEFDVSVLEAEALWGKPIREATDSLRIVVHEVNVAIDAFVADAASGGEDFSSDREFGKKMRSIVSAHPTDSENELNKKLAAAVQAIDDQLRQHLQRS